MGQGDTRATDSGDCCCRSLADWLAGGGVSLFSSHIHAVDGYEEVAAAAAAAAAAATKTGEATS